MNKWLKAELDHWEAQKSQALATLESYFNNPIGIGEHSNVAKEIHDWTNKLSEATENLENLRTHFLEGGKSKNVKTLLND